MEILQLEDFCIVGVGAIMHLSNLSLISALNNKATVLMPNAASLLVAVTLLSLLTQWRPGWSNLMASTRSQHLFLLILELMIIVGLVELMLVQIWVPMLIVLNIVCEYTTHALLMANNEYLVYNTPHFAFWLRSKAFYQARFLLALAFALGILLSQGWQSVILKSAQNMHAIGSRAGTNTDHRPPPTVKHRGVKQLTRRVRYVPLGDGQELEEEYSC
ncbi:E3 SUMO-protein ligase PIAS2 [Drosophila madeirensis]|uniref:E3 SUMO-protein ligase PIAS2 n=1 Tax=Drosophila madeirensis TaxID=30013 RepID=A0AAU9G8A6_DROMD